MLGRNSTSTTRTAGTTSTAGMTSSGTRPARRSIFDRLHPGKTNPALEAQINSVAVLDAQARAAQRELRARDVTPPKRSLSTRIKRLSNKWRGTGRATSKSTQPTY